MKRIDENGNKSEYVPGGLLEVNECACTSQTPKDNLCDSCKVKGIPLHRRDSAQVDSWRKMNGAIKKERILTRGY